jgi:Regulator of ribonuclease activity B
MGDGALALSGLPFEVVARLLGGDKQQLIDLSWEGQLAADPVEVSHFFSFPLNEDGARAANTQLQGWGYETWLVKESESGEYSNYWHIAAAKPQALSANVIARTRGTMESLAERHGGRYDCWEVSHRSPKLSDRRIRSLLQQLRASRERAVGNARR